MKLHEIATDTPGDIHQILEYLTSCQAELFDNLNFKTRVVKSISDLPIDKNGFVNFSTYSLSLIGENNRLNLPPGLKNLTRLELTNINLNSWDELPDGIERLIMGLGHLPNPAQIPKSMSTLEVTDSGFSGSILPLFDGRLQIFAYSFVGDDGFVELFYNKGIIKATMTPDNDESKSITTKLDDQFELQDWMISHNLEHMI